MLSKLIGLPRPAKLTVLLAMDALIAAAALWAAVLVRAGTIANMASKHGLALTVLFMVLVPLAALSCGMYRSVTRFHTPLLPVKAALTAFLSGAVLSLLAIVSGAVVKSAFGIGVVFALMLFFFILLSRNVARALLHIGSATHAIPVAIYGAGSAGRQLVALMRQTQQYRPVIFVDDDPALTGRVLEDLPVISPGHRKFADKLAAKRVQEIFLAIPSVGPSRRRQILERLGDLHYRVRSVPNLDELTRGSPHLLADLREISANDLLGRDAVRPIPGLLEKCIVQKTVLVTGGGGSIGSELCRQIIALKPTRLIVLEHAEFAIYELERELRLRCAADSIPTQLIFCLGSVTDRDIVSRVFQAHRVDTVYHAAAYKHVPIVEGNPIEGLKNNVLGTWYVARAAAAAAVSHFVLISSDKAVRPTNVMGATKRLAELVVQAHAERYPQTIFSMVRFGNVLDSSGSVVPLFRKQIESGGPVTLTHSDVTRYFMTISEAVELVIQAGAMATGGEVFLLDMGDPVRIRDLAFRMIHLTGRTVRDEGNPHGDIAVEVVGLRPGEKLYEELLISGEARGTTHERIWHVREEAATAQELELELKAIEASIAGGAHIDVRQILRKWVSGYQPQNGTSVKRGATTELQYGAALSQNDEVQLSSLST